MTISVPDLSIYSIAVLPIAGGSPRNSLRHGDRHVVPRLYSGRDAHRRTALFRIERGEGEVALNLVHFAKLPSRKLLNNAEVSESLYSQVVTYWFPDPTDYPLIASYLLSDLFCLAP